MGVEPTSPAWKAGTFAARPRAHAAEGEGVEPSRLIARLFSKQLPSPIGLPFRKAAEAGIEPASRRLTVAFPYQHRTHRNSQSGRLDLNQRSRAPEARAPFPEILAKLSHALNRMRPAGIEPTHPAWQAGRLPLHHGRKVCEPSCQRTSEHRVGLEAVFHYRTSAFLPRYQRDSNGLSCRCTRAESSPLDDQCFVISGTRGTRTLTRLGKNQGCCR